MRARLASEIVESVLNELLRPNIGASEKSEIILQVSVALQDDANEAKAVREARRLLGAT